MSKYVRWFKTVDEDDINIIGAKALNLGKMFQSGYPVPAGFCVMADAYKRFVQGKIQEKISDLIALVAIVFSAFVSRCYCLRLVYCDPVCFFQAGHALGDLYQSRRA